ncbi:hypothetical protein HanRHA438_Chr01g0034911 [Helianthus annuus]|nr:hypothetical protein HanHA300_Chr01g0027641 [Helianthus annuus]KAJ0623925.1 hypothetical protein HanIR_Chr01g0037581 [Helianthus annuus]KAJ0784096.1 hypothetical protein HanLR1_Chr01g0028351 [Helianthus annuus]KAJ0812164.1 hypothetical protein HanPSC8_Chr17g0758831 [Helianthus annuus]KAJ0812165.1 hypothetical protein HanPSC8_Chr17g0758861 [Helianthus annuus]
MSVALQTIGDHKSSYTATYQGFYTYGNFLFIQINYHVLYKYKELWGYGVKVRVGIDGYANITKTRLYKYMVL